MCDFTLGSSWTVTNVEEEYLVTYFNFTVDEIALVPAGFAVSNTYFRIVKFHYYMGYI